ncbi:MAG: DUF2190 family protein [Lachnospiraceae bacterium]|nr:DUF2190 family protein [Lachnospiraceae bacterium]
MSKAAYWQRGDTLDYKNETGVLIEANTILSIGSRVGVAGTNIPAGAVGSVHVLGIFEMPKSDDAEIKMGTTVYFDGTGITTAAETAEKVSNVHAGYCAETSPKTSDVILVKLLG